MKKQILILGLSLCFSAPSIAQNLEAYLKVAAENNAGLKANYLRFEAALQQVTQLSSLPDPNLSFGYFISPIETRVGPQQARFSLNQMFPWFGTLKVQEKAAKLKAEAQYQEFLDARNYLYFRVATGYYELLKWEETKAIEEENLIILQTFKEITRLKFQNGQGAMVDVLRVDLMLKEAETNLSILNKQQIPLSSRFNQLLNRPTNEKVLIEDSLSLSVIPAAYRKDSLLHANPQVEKLSLQIKASQTDEQLAIKRGLPQLGLGLDYVMVGERQDLLVPDNGKDAFMPMISLSLPIFRKKHQAAQKEARLMQESYTLQKEEISERLQFDYNQAWFEIDEQQELISLYQAQIKNSKQSLRLLHQAYANAGKDFEEVLRMQQQLLQYQKLKAAALAKYYQSWAKLNYITAKK